MTRVEKFEQILILETDLVCGEYSEGVDDLFGGVDVCGFASHEVEEAVELDVAACVGVQQQLGKLRGAERDDFVAIPQVRLQVTEILPQEEKVLPQEAKTLP